MSESYYNAKNLIVGNGFVRNPERYYLEDFFNNLPSLTKNGTVTQATNHTTAVTLNANSGIITLAAVALNATTNAEFTFNNNVIKTSSQIFLTMQDENTTNNNQLACAVHTIANGSCIITLVNPHSSGATSATASKIHFRIFNNPINDNFLITGTNATNSSVDFSSTRAGIKLTTAGADNDQVILYPDTDGNAWSNIKWGTENEVEWECAISVADVSNVAFWAGLKTTNTPVLATDDDQAYFFFDTDDSVVGTLTVNTTLHFGYSVNGTDYTTNLGITVGANTIYRLRIVIDNYRQVSIYVNGIQYGLSTTAGSAGLTQSTNTKKSAQLLNDIDLIPYIGVQSTTGDADTLTVYYEKISRMLFE